jgi:hypothetical protein
MTLRRLFPAFVLPALMALLLFPAASSAVRPLETGVTTPDANRSERLGYDRIKQAGANMTRIIINWALVAPDTEPESWDPTDPDDPNYDWSEYDFAIGNATDAGLRVLASIYKAPAWAERCKADIDGICDPDPDMFADFTEAAAERYNGSGPQPRVQYWKAWNEPNLFLFFLPQFRNGKKVSPGLYRVMLNKFATRVRAAHPTNLVVGGGLAPLQRPGGLGPLDFMRRLLCLKGRSKPKPIPGCGAKAKFDIWANNPYTTGGPTHESAGPDDVSLGDLPKVKKVIRAASRYRKVSSKPKNPALWVTEFSWDSNKPDPGAARMSTLKKWVPEALYGAWKAGVSKFFWLSLRDWERAPGLPYSQTIESGLYFRGETLAADKPKPILRAFRFPLVAYRKKTGLKVWGRTPGSNSAKVIIRYRLNGGWRKIRAMRSAGNGIFTTFIRTRKGKRNRGAVQAEVKGGPAKTLGQSKSLPFKLKPIRDYFQPPFG